MSLADLYCRVENLQQALYYLSKSISDLPSGGGGGSDSGGDGGGDVVPSDKKYVEIKENENLSGSNYTSNYLTTDGKYRLMMKNDSVNIVFDKTAVTDQKYYYSYMFYHNGTIRCYTHPPDNKSQVEIPVIIPNLTSKNNVKYIDENSLQTKLNDYYTKTEADNNFSTK